MRSSRTSANKSMPPVLGPAAASRLAAPWAFLNYEPTIPVDLLLERGVGLVRYVRQECHRGHGASSSPGRAIKDGARNVMHVRVAADLHGVSISRVLRTLAGPTATSFDDFFDRLLGDKLEGMTLHRNACADVHGRPWVDPSRVPPRMASMGSLYYDDSSLFKKVTRELVYLDYMHIHSDKRSITRVFKSVDSDDPTTPHKKHVERHKHILFGYCIDDFRHLEDRNDHDDDDDDDKSSVRVTFYGEYAMAPEPCRLGREAKHFLEKLGTSVQLLQRMLACHPPKLSASHITQGCRSCFKSFSLFRSPISCVTCTHWFCANCVSPHDSSLPSGHRRCHACHDTSRRRHRRSRRSRHSRSSLTDGATSISSTPTNNHDDGSKPSTPPSQSATSKLALQAPCAQCVVRSATLACRLCRDLCCQPCCRVERFVDPHEGGSFEVWTCINCIAQTTAETSPIPPPQVKLQPTPTPSPKKPPPHPFTKLKAAASIDPINPRPSSVLLFNYLMRISEGSESSDHNSPACVGSPSSPPPTTSAAPPIGSPVQATSTSSPPASPPLYLPAELASDQPGTEPSPAAIDQIRTTAVLDLDTNDALDAICLQAATKMECTFAFVNLIYKG
ncbi:hypothetical protein DYB28_012958, partial [Aphanomyces astaci]